MKRIALPALVLVGAFTLGACTDTGLEPTPVFDSQFSTESDPAQTSSASASASAPAPGTQSIVDIVVASTEANEPQFTLLLAAINYIAETNPQSPLLAGLFSNSQLTVFAPTDAAFGALVEAVMPLLNPTSLDRDGPFAAIDEKLGAGTVETVVAYHVTSGRRAANSVVPRVGSRRIQTLAGASFSVSPSLRITAVGNTANIVAPNISASNGIIHVIDAVILPIELPAAGSERMVF
jgi:uncharacterized surface protein with fasciclin (FAS1) repeats